MFIDSWLLAATSPAVGQEVVELSSEDLWLDADFAEVFSLGSLDAPEWQHFGLLRTAAFDAAGNLHLLDQDARTIVVVDPTGGFLRTIGRSGNGPGEFDLPQNLVILPDGRIVVTDIPRHRAFQIFYSDGSFDRSVRVGNDLLGVEGRIDVDRGTGGGLFVASGDLVRYLPMQPEEQKDPPGKRSVLRLSLEGDELVQEVVAHGWAPPSAGPVEVRIGSRTVRSGETTPHPRIFDPGFFVGALPGGGVAFSDSTAYRIMVTDPAGEIERILRRPFEPEPVTDRIVEEEIERRLEEIERTAVAVFRRASMVVDGGGNPIQGMIPDDMIREGAVRSQRRFLEARSTADEVPIVRNLRTTWDGEIWVQRRGEKPVSDGPIDVLIPDGGYLGSYPAGTPMPDAFGPDGLVAFIETGDLEQYTVRVSRVPSANGRQR
ncbi:MAG: hypothetical protein F4X47_11950 [Gammaproteobacteria bacterium]|nr:hypothetical protein [Gammaproteobacteria bacterium]MYC53018.1 hypothetical protein [Gammaproteobacteria bacterium]